MKVRNVLLVEDDPLISRAWSLGLNQSGYSVISAHTLASGKELLSSRSFDAAIVDVNLPDGRGYELLEWMKIENFKVSTLMVTARQDEEAALQSLQQGATEFIRKPIGPRELVARLERLFPEPRDEPVSSVYFRDFHLNESTKETFFLGKSLSLSPSEFEIMRLLVRFGGHPVARHLLFETLGLDNTTSDRTIDSHISRIRKKLKGEAADSYAIVSVWGNGYSLRQS